MKYRVAVVFAGVLLAHAGRGQTPERKSAPEAKAEASTMEKRLEAYAAKFLSFNPDSRITVTKSTNRTPGLESYRVQRKGQFEKLNVDKVYYTTTDGRWFFAGDVVSNSSPRPMQGLSDLEWIDKQFSNLFHTRVRTQLAPDQDVNGWKGVLVGIETGYLNVRMPGYVSPDSRFFLQGTFWDLQMDPRAERRRRIDLSANRATGPANATVQIVEYADMECGYCKLRGTQLDRLLEANVGVVNARRHYKFFPLWIAHVWAMKAASAADCIFKFGNQAMFRFKQQVYSRQESMTVSGIDELAVTVAEAEGVSSADFLSCYLQEDSFGRIKKDLEEGYRLGVYSTPTYYIDGTEVTWLEDRVMEDYLRTLFPKIKTINYAP
jgi:protein-disulfide isomerase